jgi:hypothetical protein
MGFQVVYPVVFTAWFFANQQAIANRYCVNKKRPTLHCDGKCFLAQKIKAAEEKNQPEQNGVVRNVWVETPPCILQQSDATAPVLAVIGAHAWPYWNTPLHSAWGSSVYRPPALAS